MTVATLTTGNVQPLSRRELEHWMAYHLYFEPLGDHWRQTSLLAEMAISPHLKKGHKLNPDHFVPVRKFRQTAQQLADMLKQSVAALAGRNAKTAARRKAQRDAREKRRTQRRGGKEEQPR
tara:strand:+ start:3411 stop:3773 length:363 start_codon:yes stop_codon:yes gene_type:complete